MAEPFKNLFNRGLISGMAQHLTRASAEVEAGPFDGPAFEAYASEGLEDLELKARSARITEALVQALPEDFETAARVLQASLHPVEEAELGDAAVTPDGLRAWAVMPMSDYVALRGLGDFDRALALLREMTMRFSSEFAIRAFLVADADRTLGTLERWAGDPNAHVRRLVSEGTRPRLPWGTRLTAFVADPSPVLTLLERLKDDPSETVRRSVANNLNDIAKDHPDLVVEVTGRWMEDASDERAALVRHACRTLVKQGHPGALAVLGYGPPKVRLDTLEVATPLVHLGGALEFSIRLTSESDAEQPLILDYVVHHRKASGSTSPKVFKWKTFTLPPRATHAARRRHAIKPISTRVYHPGTHHVEIQVNGRVLGRRSFELELGAATGGPRR